MQGVSPDIWQPIRMAAIWPVLIAATSVLATVDLLWFTGHGKVTRRDFNAAFGVGVFAWVVCSMMAAVWDNTAAYWFAFTVGLALVALALVMTCAVFYLEMHQ